MKSLNFRTFLIQTICVLSLSLATTATLSGQTTHDISTGSLTINPGSGDYIIKGDNSSSPTNYVLIQSGYVGTITLDTVSITTTGNSPITVIGLNDCSPLAPVTRVNVILKGDNTLTPSTNNYAAFRVDQGAQIHISAYDVNDNASGKLTAHAPNGGAGIGACNQGAGAFANQGSSLISGPTGVTCATAGPYTTSGGNVIISTVPLEIITLPPDVLNGTVVPQVTPVGPDMGEVP